MSIMSNRTVIAFQSNPEPQYVPVNSLSIFPAPPLLPGLYRVPSYPQRFPTPWFNKSVSDPMMTVQTIYNYERSGRIQY